MLPEGELVWEYVNPDFAPAAAAAKSQYNTVFRVCRYTVEEVAKSTGGNLKSVIL